MGFWQDAWSLMGAFSHGCDCTSARLDDVEGETLREKIHNRDRQKIKNKLDDIRIAI